jgi:membrane protein YqaA with SNARE-associated domain
MHRLKTLGSPSFWLRRVVDARAGQGMLFGASFLEGLILPIPLEAVLAPYMQMRRDILWRIATIGVLGFVCAALAG